jgi:hypothetical protein
VQRVFSRIIQLLWSAVARKRAKAAIAAALLSGGLFATIDATRGSADDDQSAGSTSAAQRSEAAIQTFWRIYHGNDYDAIPQAQAELRRALRRDSDNATLYALLAATHFWHFGEAARDPQLDSNALAEDISTSVRLFRRALELDYYSEHVPGHISDDRLPGYLGITTVHAGLLARDANLVAQGDELLDFAVYQFPEFNNFNRWAAHNDDPKDSDAYQKALESLWQALDTCIGRTLDRGNPDIASYLHLQTSVGRKKVCWSEGDLAPHSFEGLLLNLGNGLVKGGQVEVARTIYASARYADNYDRWPYRHELEAVAASDLLTRAALYADADPSNDPALGVPGRGCVYCHATVAERARGSQGP